MTTWKASLLTPSETYTTITLANSSQNTLGMELLQPLVAPLSLDNCLDPAPLALAAIFEHTHKRDILMEPTFRMPLRPYSTPSISPNLPAPQTKLPEPSSDPTKPFSPKIDPTPAYSRCHL
jgi:hypothetical protein